MSRQDRGAEASRFRAERTDASGQNVFSMLFDPVERRTEAGDDFPENTVLMKRRPHEQNAYAAAVIQEAGKSPIRGAGY